MRRLLVVTVSQAVVVTAALVGAAVAALLLWPGDPLKSLAPASDQDFKGTPPVPAVLAALLVAVLVAGGLALAIAALVADRRASRLAHFLATLGERAERLGPGDPRPVPLRSGIEEVDRLDAALARGAQQGAKRLASERDFAADASHQLRTPLTALLMRLEEIASTDDLAVVEEEATIAIDQVERLSRVVDDLMSRTLSGTETTPAVSLDSVLASLQREWQPAFAGARRSIHVSGERGLGVRATPTALAQILTTLLENSLMYGRGTVEIAARRSSSRWPTRVTACPRRSLRTSSSGRCRRRGAAWGSRWRGTSPRPPGVGSSWSARRRHCSPCSCPPARSDGSTSRTPDRRARAWPRPTTPVYGGAMGPRTPWLGLMVTTLLVGLGLTEDADGARGVETGVVLPVGVLVGGGLLVLAGTILEGVLPVPALVLTALGCGASIPAALWTVVVPMLLVALFVRRAWQLPEMMPRSASVTRQPLDA